jgi:hypothetical protein
MQRTNAASSVTAALVLAALVLATSTTASARPKKDSAVSSESPFTLCNGTPVIMQGLDCPRRPAREEPPERAAGRAKRPQVTARGSSGVNVAPLPPPLPLTPVTPVAPYVPPAVSNPSARIMQYNQSFPLNGGLGLNPTDRDSYVRYNFTR